MNLLNNPANWGDPIWWNPDTLAYEVLIDDPYGTSFSMGPCPAAADGDTIAFDYEVDAIRLDGEYPGYLEIQRWSDGSTFWALDLAETGVPASGHAELTCEVGEQYSFILRRQAGDQSALIYDLTAIITPVPDPTPPATVSFNCECDDPNPSRTLVELRTELMRRLGFSAMTANPPPGMPELLNSFLQGAQRQLYRQYPVLRTERFYRWPMMQGLRFYDVDGNDDACLKKLDPRMISWVGISLGDDQWRPLVCGIPPECYQSHDQHGIPYRYEIRQCIEVWPAPDNGEYVLRIKGDFGLEPFAEDADQCTIDDEAVFLFALARAKAHYGQPDAINYQQDAIAYIRNLTAGAHHTRRYVPGEAIPPPWPQPIWLPKVY